jgi:sugar phosphate isomerase/epimerase
MKISIRAGMRPVRGSTVNPLRWAIERASELGIDGLELMTRADRGQMAWDIKPEARQEIKALCAQYKVAILSLSADWAWAYAMFFPGYREWGRKGVDLMAGDAQLAQELGAHTILMHFGSAKGTWDEAKAMLKDIANAGEQYGVRFGFEANIWGNTTGFGKTDTLLRMVDEVGSPNFGVYLHNAWPRGQGGGGGDPLDQEIAQCGTKLVQSMHSSILTDGNVIIDWQKTVAAMKKYFPDGAYTFEIPWEVAAENKKIVDEALAKYW